MGVSAQRPSEARSPETVYYANAYADHYGLPRELIHAVITHESTWHQNAVSNMGAMGLMQLMPATAEFFSVQDPTSIQGNISGGVRYLAVLYRQFHGDLRMVLAAYYCGSRHIVHSGLNYPQPRGGDVRGGDAETVSARDCSPSTQQQERNTRMNPTHRVFALLPLALIATIHPAFSQEARPSIPVTPVAAFAGVQPVVSEVTISNNAVTDVRPLFTTTIRVPDPISSVAVGAPTLFEAEHSDQEARLIYVKPTTNKAAESNLVVTMQSGETISTRLLSDGASTLNAPVDFIVDYRPRQSFFIGSSDPIPSKASETPQRLADPIADALERQSKVSTPAWEHGTAVLGRSGSKKDPPAISDALGGVSESGGEMLVAYSVVNQSTHWIDVLPPQIEVNSPGRRTK